MTFIIRLPSILVLLALVALSVLGALGALSMITGYAPPIAVVQGAQAEAAATGAADANWIDVGLFVAAAIFFLISAIRLVRRTQAFWSWLLGFAAYAGRWAYAQGEGVVGQVQGIDPGAYLAPQGLLNDLASTETQVALLAITIIVGLLIFVIDAADRAYWDRQGA